MPESLLKVTNIKKAFAGVKALKEVSLTIERGEIRCLAGENGSGKSTLIKVISGVHIPDGGTIEINGRSYQHLTPIESMNEGIQVIYQDFSIFPNLTAAENIALNNELAQNKRFVNWKKVHDIAKMAIDKIGVTIDLKAKVETLSVADKQLIAISRALLQNAKLIIMDEPTTALTKKEVDALFKVIKGLQKDGISILFVSHKLDEVFEISEKITILRNGENVIDGDVSEFDHDKFVYYMTGRKIVESYFEYQEKQKEIPLLKVDNISQTGGIQNVSFELYEGEVLGITGLLGSGRTELANALFGINPINKGDILIENKVTKISSVQDAIRNKIGYVPEDRLTEGLFLNQSIGKNIFISVIDQLVNGYQFLDQEKVNQEIEHWIDSMKIVTSTSDAPVQTLSGGNQQRVVLAKWLATKPKILILNGPTVGVDIGSKSDIHQIVRKLAKEGVGVIIISDDISEVVHNCNRILVMKKGRIFTEVDNKKIEEHELTRILNDE